MTAAELNAKQVEILQQLLSGKRGVDIATERGITKQALNGYVKRLREKIGVRTLVQVGAWCERHGIREAGQG